MKKKRILHLEDEDSIIQLVKEMLNGEYDYNPVKNIEEALEAVDKKHFDLILLDLKLGNTKDIHGELLGFKFLKKIEEMNDKMSVVIVSALSEKAKEAKKRFKKIIKGIVSKPFRKKVLIKNIKRVLK